MTRYFNCVSIITYSDKRLRDHVEQYLEQVSVLHRKYRAFVNVHKIQTTCVPFSSVPTKIETLYGPVHIHKAYIAHLTPSTFSVCSLYCNIQRPRSQSTRMSSECHFDTLRIQQRLIIHHKDGHIGLNGCKMEKLNINDWKQQRNKYKGMGITKLK